MTESLSAQQALHSGAVAPVQGDVLRLLTCGSVDDGKSTLIGRLLWDSGRVHDDRREALRQHANKTGNTGDELDFNLLVDGLQAEREQGITIDIAWRYFDSPHRRMVIIDAPGHEQYTRNMASGASHADVAILLIDARHGIKQQTRRHAAICDLVGIRRLILAVNKMDLVEWSQSRFHAIEAEFKRMLGDFQFEDVTGIPIAARQGHNVVNRSAALSWYTGPTLIDYLESAPARGEAPDEPLRFPVQMVLRDTNDFRGYAGTVGSGTVRVGDCILEPVSGRSATVDRIATFDGDRPSAKAGAAVSLVLNEDIDISRGAVLCDTKQRSSVSSVIEAKLVWLSDAPFHAGANYLLRTATDLVPIREICPQALIDLETLSERPSSSVALNDIARMHLELGRPTAVDVFGQIQCTSVVKLIDAMDGGTVAGGIVVDCGTGRTESDKHNTVLSSSILRQGLCADLGDSPEDRDEFMRRLQEVETLMRLAGINVSFSKNE